MQTQAANKHTTDIKEQFETINASMKRLAGAIGEMAADANILSVAAVEGKLATRADAKKHRGDFRKIVQGVNDTLDAVIGPLECGRHLC